MLLSRSSMPLAPMATFWMGMELLIAAEPTCNERTDCAGVESNTLLTVATHHQGTILQSCSVTGTVNGKQIGGDKRTYWAKDEEDCMKQCAKMNGWCVEYEFRTDGNPKTRCKLFNRVDGYGPGSKFRHGPPSDKCPAASGGGEPVPDPTPQPTAVPVPDPTPQPTAVPVPDPTPAETAPSAPGACDVRVRQEIRQVQGTQWIYLKEAWSSLATGSPPAYDYFGMYHNLDNKKSHGDPYYTFLPYHRALAADLEDLLRQKATELRDSDAACGMALPYWDWTGGNMEDVLSEERFGVTGDDGCVKMFEGASFTTPESWYEEGKYEKGLVTDGRICVMRNPEIQTKGLQSGKKMYATAKVDDVAEFTHKVESLHGQLHGRINGNMGSRVGGHSASDPVFFLHHGFIDYLWFRWQKARTNDYVTAWLEELSDVHDTANPVLAVADHFVSAYEAETDCVMVPPSTKDLEKSICLRYEESEYAQ